jgi:hypothetical protein
MAAALVFLATAAFVLWQNARLTVLWDLSYTLDSSYRIALGQMPYRDFPLAHAPLTFLIQAAIMRLAGRVFYHHVLYAALVGGLGSVVAWRILLWSLRGRVGAAWGISLVLAAPLTVLGIYSILPHPSYDCDCGCAVLVGIYLLQRLNGSIRRGFITGAALVVPLFFKQNIGLPFLGIALASIVLLLGARWLRRSHEMQTPGNNVLVAVLGGASAALLSALLLLLCTAGVGNYIYWTVQFAAQRRLPGLHDMLGVYAEPALLWMIPCIIAALILLRYKRMWTQLAALALFAAPFLWSLLYLFLNSDADDRADNLLGLWPLLLLLAAALSLRNLLRGPSLRALLPVIALAAVNGAMLSQQLWGSTYAIWPLLFFLIAEMMAYIFECTPKAARIAVAPAIAVLIAFTFFLCGGLYAASDERLSYADLNEGPVRHSALPALAGMAVSGDWLPQFEDLVQFANKEIPMNDGIILIPGEDPFYFVTGRVPQFPVLLFDPATDPYSPAQLVEQARAHNIRWLIVKRNLQIREDPTPQREAALPLLLREFTRYSELQNYDIYRRP